MMVKSLVTNGLILLSSIQLLADIGHLDIYIIIWQDTEYYLTLGSPGMLQNNDLCYYDFNGDYKMEVKEYIDICLKKNIEIRMFTDVEEIVVDSLRNSDGSLLGLESPIYVLKGFSLVHSDSIDGQYELIGAKKGNTSGTDSSQSITEKDNDWINMSTMKHIFYVDNGECTYNFYCSSIEPNSKSAIELQSELQGLMPKGEGELDMEFAVEREKEFRRRVEEMVQDKILMLGGCSC